MTPNKLFSTKVFLFVATVSLLVVQSNAFKFRLSKLSAPQLIIDEDGYVGSAPVMVLACRGGYWRVELEDGREQCWHNGYKVWFERTGRFDSLDAALAGWTKNQPAVEEVVQVRSDQVDALGLDIEHVLTYEKLLDLRRPQRGCWC